MGSIRLHFWTLAALVVLSSGSEFLKAQPSERGEHVTEDEIRASFLAEVEGALGTGSATNRVHLVESVLKPMYAALPKNQHGNLGHSTVRYALHRLFTLRHGWRVRGLTRETDPFNISSPSGVLKGQVPSYIQDMFEKRLGDKGLGLQELAVMAATMEHLIHQEAMGKLGEAYTISQIPPTEKVNQETADFILGVYMMSYILEEDLTNLTVRQAGMLMQKMPTFFSAWDDTKAFLRRIRTNITGDPSSFDFSMLTKVAETVGEEYGTFQDTECRDIKAFLMEREVRGSGRVRLSDFWKPALDGGSVWQFRESIGYLRQLGALDESDPNDMTVVIPNYLHSHTNCVARSNYYAVCCKDECENLLGHLEKRLAVPEATPSAIAAIVENLPSSTVKSPRKLSSTLLRRLEDTAAEHGGMVPLHGRLFAQWLHHAYPRECPYPHESGSVVQQTGIEFAMETGTSQYTTKDNILEYLSYAGNLTSSDIEDDEELLPWSPAEELLVERSATRPMQTRSAFAKLRPVALMAASATFAFGFVKNWEPALMLGDRGGNAKFIV